MKTPGMSVSFSPINSLKQWFDSRRITEICAVIKDSKVAGMVSVLCPLTYRHGLCRRHGAQRVTGSHQWLAQMRIPVVAAIQGVDFMCVCLCEQMYIFFVT